MGRQLQLASSKIIKPPPALQVYAAVGRHPIPKKNRDQPYDSQVAYGALRDLLVAENELDSEVLRCCGARVTSTGTSTGTTQWIRPVR